MTLRGWGWHLVSLTYGAPRSNPLPHTKDMHMHPEDAKTMAAVDKAQPHIPTPDYIRNVNQLQDLVNAHLPDGMSARFARKWTGDSRDHSLILLGLDGAEVNEDGEFVPEGVSLNPTHTLATQINVDDFRIDDVFVDGFDLSVMLNDIGSGFNASGGYAESLVSDSLHTRGLTVADADVENADDVYVAVEMTVTFDVEVTLEDLGITGEERFHDADEARDQVQALLTRWIEDDLFISEPDMSIDITTADIGL